jgi:hypothetical protein
VLALTPFSSQFFCQKKNKIFYIPGYTIKIKNFFSAIHSSWKDLVLVLNVNHIPEIYSIKNWKLFTDENCEFSNFYFSPNANYYIQECKGPFIGETVVRRASDLSVVWMVEDHSRLRASLNGKKLPKTLRLMVEVTEQFKAPVILHLPNDYDKCNG